jgi:hypothetical protein
MPNPSIGTTDTTGTTSVNSINHHKNQQEENPGEHLINEGLQASKRNVSETINLDGITGYTGITDINNFTSKIQLQPVSPVRDFTKTPNSINRMVMAHGLFRGKSKQIYDYLWQISRGAIKPSRTVRCTHSQIKRGAGIGSRNTIIDGIKHLAQIELIKFVSSVGVNDGNEYEIFTPEELGYPGYTSLTGSTDTTGTSGISGISQNLDVPIQPDSGITGTIQNTQNKDTSDIAKTLIKTNKEENDDERLRVAFGEFQIILDETIKKHTGKGISSTDRIKWKHVGEVLAAQIDLIASRTTISNGPAVLAEHLQRHLNNKRMLEKMGLITPAEAKEMKEPVSIKQEIPFLFLCPDCKGTRMWNPDGKGMRPGCPHTDLEEAVKKAKDAGEI